MTNDEIRQQVIDYFRGRCIFPVSLNSEGFPERLCWKPFNHVHEIVPKSMNPKGWDTFENRIPLCSYHHLSVVHLNGARNYINILRNARIFYSEKVMKNGYNSQEKK